MPTKEVARIEIDSVEPLRWFLHSATLRSETAGSAQPMTEFRSETACSEWISAC